VLQWARENGCPWNEVTCSNAADKVNIKSRYSGRVPLNLKTQVTFWVIWDFRPKTHMTPTQSHFAKKKSSDFFFRLSSKWSNFFKEVVEAAAGGEG
jgi:hypothetical protein